MLHFSAVMVHGYMPLRCHAVAISEAEAICATPCTAVAQATASVPSVYECATGDPTAATDAAKAQAPSLGVPSGQVYNSLSPSSLKLDLLRLGKSACTTLHARKPVRGWSYCCCIGHKIAHAGRL